MNSSRGTAIYVTEKKNKFIIVISDHSLIRLSRIYEINYNKHGFSFPSVVFNLCNETYLSYILQVMTE